MFSKETRHFRNKENRYFLCLCCTRQMGSVCCKHFLPRTESFFTKWERSVSFWGCDWRWSFWGGRCGPSLVWTDLPASRLWSSWWGRPAGRRPAPAAPRSKTPCHPQGRWHAPPAVRATQSRSTAGTRWWGCAWCGLCSCPPTVSDLKARTSAGGFEFATENFKKNFVKWNRNTKFSNINKISKKIIAFERS